MNNFGGDSRRPNTDPVERSVPCGVCTICCQGDAVFIHPEMGDRSEDYKTQKLGDRLILTQKPNGDCIYLERKKGCTIWEKRPGVCRELDCADFFRKLSSRERSELVRKGLLTKRILNAAKRRRNRR